MAQGRQQNNGSRQRCAQSAAAKASAEPPKAVCAQLEQLNRKLAAASAEILRYQTRLFACERQMAALRQENAQLEIQVNNQMKARLIDDNIIAVANENAKTVVAELLSATVQSVDPEFTVVVVQ